MQKDTIDARLTPERSMHMLSQHEIEKICGHAGTDSYELFRRCALAILASSEVTDDADSIDAAFPHFSIDIIQQDRGIKLDVRNAPASAFVDGEMIKGIKEHLFSVLRDILYISNKVRDTQQFDLNSSDGITNAVFRMLRNAGNFQPDDNPRMVVCWGGHSIARHEYEYTKEVGYAMGLRSMDICTGCGPGAMKGPMKGATIAHAKQRINNGRYVGLTEPGIIAAEAPNPIVNELIIMPDIEKRLEAFVRTAHGIVVFPGGAGTAEEILFILGILMNPKNADIPFPLILTGPEKARELFSQINEFIEHCLGKEATHHYDIIINDPEQVAKRMFTGIQQVRDYRKAQSDAYYYNWRLHIDEEFQRPFDPTHEAMQNLKISHDIPKHQLAANLRRAFSGIVAGNVKKDGVERIAKYGPYKIQGDPDIMQRMDKLLDAYVKQDRMKLPGGESYTPCYEVIR